MRVGRDIDHDRPFDRVVAAFPRPRKAAFIERNRHIGSLDHLICPAIRHPGAVLSELDECHQGPFRVGYVFDCR